jgi:hypothetical protein|tara:strand:+ start:1244 stop:1504 length:261 start_codon:yes stop_codon:yes gene_type:complete
MRDRIKELLQEFKIDELARVDYKEGEIVMEYIEGYDYPRYALYYDSPTMISIDGPKEEEYEMIAEFDSRFFDAGMVKTVMEYLQTR